MCACNLLSLFLLLSLLLSALGHGYLMIVSCKCQSKSNAQRATCSILKLVKETKTKRIETKWIAKRFSRPAASTSTVALWFQQVQSVEKAVRGSLQRRRRGRSRGTFDANVICNHKCISQPSQVKSSQKSQTLPEAPTHATVIIYTNVCDFWLATCHLLLPTPPPSPLIYIYLSDSSIKVMRQTMSDDTVCSSFKWRKDISHQEEAVARWAASLVEIEKLLPRWSWKWNMFQRFTFFSSPPPLSHSLWLSPYLFLNFLKESATDAKVEMRMLFVCG